MSETLDEKLVVPEVPASEVDALPDEHPGVDDGVVDGAGEKVVYEYDEGDALIGWHKEPADGGGD